MRAIFAQGFWGMMTTMDTRLVARWTIGYALKGKRVYVPGLLNGLVQWAGSLLPVALVTNFVGKRWQAA